MAWNGAKSVKVGRQSVGVMLSFLTSRISKSLTERIGFVFGGTSIGLTNFNTKLKVEVTRSELGTAWLHKVLVWTWFTMADSTNIDMKTFWTNVWNHQSIFSCRPIQHTAKFRLVFSARQCTMPYRWFHQRVFVGRRFNDASVASQVPGSEFYWKSLVMVWSSATKIWIKKHSFYVCFFLLLFNAMLILDILNSCILFFLLHSWIKGLQKKIKLNVFFHFHTLNFLYESQIMLFMCASSKLLRHTVVSDKATKDWII